jgi:phage terminase large subunit-like protein
MTNNQMLIRAASLTSLTTFVERAMKVMIPGYTAFEFVSLVAAYIEEPILASQPGRLAINIPPRHGKTFLLIAVAAWFLGKFPKREVLLMVHSQSLAVDISGKLAVLLNSGVFKETFTKFKLQQGREGMTDFRTIQGGGFKAGSFETGITGRGTDLLLLDDTLSAQHAYREATRQAVRETYDTMLSTRINDPKTGVIVSMSHRLHEEDLTGHLLTQGFKHLCLPFVAMADEVYHFGGVTFKRAAGDVLQPGRQSLEAIESLRLSPHVFATQYQQSPTAVGAGMVRRDHFPRVLSCPPGGVTVATWDIAASQREKSSYTVCLVLQVFPDAVYLRQIIRGRFEYTKLKERALALHSSLKTVHLVEAASLGPALISDLRNEHAVVFEMKPGTSSKLERLEGVMNKIEDGFVRVIAGIPALEDFLDELTSFPFGTNDDCVDALTQLLSWVRDQVPVRKHPPVTMGAGKISKSPYRNGHYSRLERGRFR